MNDELLDEWNGDEEVMLFWIIRAVEDGVVVVEMWCSEGGTWILGEKMK